MSVVFARTRYHYDSYMDFWKLVDSTTGFQTCYVDEIDISKPWCYIVTPINGEVFPHLESQKGRTRRATLIWWCLERFDAMERPYESVIEEALQYFDTIWVSDQWIASLHPSLKFVLMGSHPGLGAEPEEIPEYDFTHQSYAWGNRLAMYNTLRRSGLREGPSAYGVERDRILRRSRLLLNLQQYPDPVSAPLRFALGAAYHLPIVSETIRDPRPFEKMIEIAEYALIPQAVAKILEDPGDMGEQLHQFLCYDNYFAKAVLEAL